MSAMQAPAAAVAPASRDGITVEEAERLLPKSEYVRCYKELARQGYCEYDPGMRYSDLPALLHKHAVRLTQLDALNMAFADVRRGCTLWDI